MRIQPIQSGELPEALVRARAAQAEWSLLPPRKRTFWLAAFRAWLVDQSSHWCHTIDAEVGKSREECLATEILPLAAACAHLAQSAPRLLAPRRAKGTPLFLTGATDKVHRRPRGVVGVIGTWNYPLLLSGVQLAQALVAGNAVVFKPSEKAPASGMLLVEGLLAAGVPPDLIQLLETDATAGETLVASEIDHLVFTGSRAVGVRIAAALAPRMVSSTLELSGHDALLVLPGADPKEAARAAWFGTMANSGRTCIATRRCLVSASLVEGFRDELAKLAAIPPSMVLDKPEGGKARLAHARGLADEAVAAGARYLTGTGESPPYLIDNVNPGMRIWREDAFAPVLMIMSCADEREMLMAEIACPFALGAAVFGPIREAEAMAMRLRAGLVTVNDVLVAVGHPDTPLGGCGASGWGATQGAEGLLEMTVPQALHISHGSFRPHYSMAIPGHADMGDLLESMLRSGHARGWAGRVAAFLALPGHAWRWWRNGKS